MRPALGVAALVAVLGLVGCTRQTTDCSGGVCTVRLTGGQTVDVAPTRDRAVSLRVGPIGPDAVTVSTRDGAVRLRPGGTAELSGVRLHLLELSGDRIGLDVRRA